MWKLLFVLPIVLLLAACQGKTAVPPTLEPIAVNDATAVTEVGHGNYQEPYELLWDPDLKELMVGHQSGVSLLKSDGTDGGTYMNTADLGITGMTDFSLAGTLASLLPDGQVVQLFVMDSGVETGTLDNFGTANDIHISPNGNTVALTSADEPSVSFWNVETGMKEKTLNGFESAVLTSTGQTISKYRVTFSRDWKTMFWIVDDTVQLQSVDSGKTGLSFQQDDLVQAIALSSKNILAVATTGSLQGDNVPIVKLWDAELGTDLGAFELPVEAMSLAFSPDGSLLATGDQDGTIMLWNVANQAVVATLTGHDNEVKHLAFSPDGRLLASAGADTVRIWGVK